MKKLLIIALLLLPLPSFAMTKTEAIVLEEVNKARVEAHKSPVTIDKSLTESAYLKGEYMRKYKFFSHNWNGLNWMWWVRKSYKKPLAGENLSWGNNPQGAVNMWLKSPLHKKNMLDSRFTKIGIRALPTVSDGELGVTIVTHYGN